MGIRLRVALLTTIKPVVALTFLTRWLHFDLAFPSLCRSLSINSTVVLTIQTVIPTGSLRSPGTPPPKHPLRQTTLPTTPLPPLHPTHKHVPLSLLSDMQLAFDIYMKHSGAFYCNSVDSSINPLSVYSIINVTNAIHNTMYCIVLYCIV